MNHYKSAAAIAAALIVGTAQAANPSDHQPLHSVLSQLGVSAVISPELSQELVSPSSSLEDALRGYNYLMKAGENGHPASVFVTGHNGDGRDTARPPAAATTLNVAYVPFEAKDVPPQYRGLPPGSVFQVSFPKDLHRMKKGDRLGLDLPTGRYEFVHDNGFAHQNGDQTWAGYLDRDVSGFRTIVTSGNNNLTGTIKTPEGDYLVEQSSPGAIWMIDVQRAGLRQGSLEGDQAVHASTLATAGAATSRRAKSPTSASGPLSTAEATVSASAKTNLDVMILYTPNFNNGADYDTRINYLIAAANQSYIDSGIQAQLRVVGRQQVSYAEESDSSAALNDLTASQGIFSAVPNTRASSGADFVILLRPFKMATQGMCGVAWVNGANGASLSSNLTYSVVSDGLDGNYYCTDWTLAHELGHNLGLAHDRENSQVQGKYPYSFAWGIDGRFGTIMSYKSPKVGKFSGPNLICDTQNDVCGYPATDPQRASDQVTSMNQTAPTAATFMPAKY